MYNIDMLSNYKIRWNNIDKFKFYSNGNCMVKLFCTKIVKVNNS